MNKFNSRRFGPRDLEAPVDGFSWRIVDRRRVCLEPCLEDPSHEARCAVDWQRRFFAYTERPLTDKSSALGQSPTDLLSIEDTKMKGVNPFSS